MNKQEILNEIKKAKLNINVLEDKINALDEPKIKTGKVLRVEDLKGKGIFLIFGDGGVIEKYKFNDKSHTSYVEMGLAFYDKQSAIDKRDAMLLAHECDIACKKSGKIEYHFFVIFCNSENELFIAHSHYKSSRFKFSTQESAQAFIDKHGEDAVRNMLLNY